MPASTIAIDVLDAGAELEPVLRALHRPAAGRVHARIDPLTRHSGWLCDSILRALGKDMTTVGGGYAINRKWEMTQAWLVGGRIDDLFITGLEWLWTPMRRNLIELAVTTGTRLWLVSSGDGNGRARARQNADWGIETVSASECAGVWASTARSAPHVENSVGPPALPRLPDDDHHFFRDACRENLDGLAAEHVETVFCNAYRCAVHWVRRNEPTVDGVSTYLRRSMSEAASADDAIIQARAIQSAMLYAGFEVKIDTRRLLTGAPHHAPQALLAAAAPRLLQLANPTYGALVVAAVLTNGALQEIADLDIDDVSHDADLLRTRRGQATVPPPLRRILRAQRHWRSCGDAGANEALFLRFYSRGPTQRATARSLAFPLATAAQHTGLAMLRTYNRRYSETDHQWRRRSGVLIRQIA